MWGVPRCGKASIPSTPGIAENREGPLGPHSTEIENTRSEKKTQANVQERL